MATEVNSLPILPTKTLGVILSSVKEMDKKLNANQIQKLFMNFERKNVFERKKVDWTA